MTPLESITKALDNIQKKHMNEYITLLESHYWYSEFSDDQRVWERGSLEFTRLLGLANSIDPEFKIFNSYAPDQFKRGGSHG